MDAEKTHVSLRTFIISLIGAIIAATTITGVYFEIVAANSKAEYVNERLDKKTKRIESDIIKVKSRVSKLEEKNIDNEN